MHHTNERAESRSTSLDDGLGVAGAYGELINTYTHPEVGIGNLVDRAVTFASFVFGGVMDARPNLKICLAHGGGYTCFGIGRMDRGWQVRSEARTHIDKPPSAYLRKFYYDCLT